MAYCSGLAWLSLCSSGFLAGAGVSRMAPFISLALGTMFGLEVLQWNASSLLQCCLFFQLASEGFSTQYIQGSKEQKDRESFVEQVSAYLTLLLSSSHSESHVQAQSQCDRGLRGLRTGRYKSLVDNFSTSQPYFGKSSEEGELQLFLENFRIWCDRSESGISGVRWGWGGSHDVGLHGLIWQVKCECKCYMLFSDRSTNCLSKIQAPSFLLPQQSWKLWHRGEMLNHHVKDNQLRQTSRPSVFFVWKINKSLLLSASEFGVAMVIAV